MTERHIPLCHDDVCITCSDAAVAVQITALRPDGLALVDTGTTIEEISVALIKAHVGDIVLVHAKEAIAILTSKPAKSVHEAVAAAVVASGSGSEGVGSAVKPAGLASLYPFLYGGEVDVGVVLADVMRSTVGKAREIVALRGRTLERLGPDLRDCADVLAAAFRTGGRLFTFGNGGSSTDAQSAAQLFLSPPSSGRALPAISLTSDVALMTALSNDIGFEVIFARQLAALGTSGDIAMAMSTSGGSLNVLRGLEEAGRRGMVTVGFSGSGGGGMAEPGVVDHLFVIESSSVHRIQEAQTTVCHVLWELVQRSLTGTV